MIAKAWRQHLLWLGFKIIEYREDKWFKDYANKNQEGVHEEICKAKNNKGDSFVDNQLVPDQHLSALSWTVSCWRLMIENATNKMMKEKKDARNNESKIMKPSTQSRL